MLDITGVIVEVVKVSPAIGIVGLVAWRCLGIVEGALAEILMALGTIEERTRKCDR